MTGDLSTCKSHSLRRMKNIFYEHGADAKIIFKDGTIKVNKRLLAIHSAFFNEVFFGQSPKTEIHVSDFDSTTFKLFLDCLMGFKPYTDLDSLLIFPIAHKYRAEESLLKCVEALRPKVMNETVCHTLNLALFYDNKDLTDSVILFLEKNCNIVALLESEEYCSHVLEPFAIAKLLENVEIDFYLVKMICKWAEKYLSGSNKLVGLNIGLFLKEHSILNKLLEISFESVKSTLDFCQFNKERNIFTSEQVIAILENNMSINYPRKFPSESMWVNVKKGEVLEEKFTKSFNFPISDSSQQMYLNVSFWRNEIVFMDSLVVGKNPVLCEVNFDFFFIPSNNTSLKTEKISKIFSKERDGNVTKSGKKTIYRMKLDFTDFNFIFLSIFSIKYTFNANCRILKTSSSNDNDISFYHTYDITAELSKINQTVNNSITNGSNNQLNLLFIRNHLTVSSTRGPTNPVQRTNSAAVKNPVVLPWRKR